MLLISFDLWIDRQIKLFLNNIDDGITRLTLNDENSGNSLSEEMMTALEDKIKSLSLNKRVKVIIIDAIGSIFSSGHNLKEITNARQNDDKGETYFKNLFDYMTIFFLLR